MLRTSVRSNCRINNIVTTYAADEGDSPITDIKFGLVFENDELRTNNRYCSDDSTTTTTKVVFIKDKIAEALYGTFTERMQSNESNSRFWS